MSGLIPLLILLVIVGFILWAVQLLPIDATMKRLAVGLGVVIVAIYVLKNLAAFGLAP